MRIKAYAKINLSLRVFEKRPDNFHEIESIMQAIGLYDALEIVPIPSGLEITCNNPHVPLGAQNLAAKAVSVFYDHLRQTTGRTQDFGWRIHIEKHIPLSAGLAGGSADAAGVLYALSLLEEKNVTLNGETLRSLGEKIGSDVPFCLMGGVCLVKGRGEVLEQLPPFPHTYYILVTPDFAVSTKWAYEAFDQKNWKMAGEDIKNDLEPVVVTNFPEILAIKERLIALGCSEAQMSGSGPTVFGAVKDKEKAHEIYHAMRANYRQFFLTEPISHGVKLA